ncbi:MAG TPA: hypothetical protein VK211_15365 [Kamptonema sp.]|nr:hypothetical protein [Kamptonema sp.]
MTYTRLDCSDELSHLSETARRYLEHAIAPKTKIASAVRLQMYGQIKLKELDSIQKRALKQGWVLCF